MYKGKHLKREKPRRWNQSAAMLVSLLLLLGITAGGTVAFLAASDGPVENTFTPSKVTTWVNEDTTTTPGTKKDVKIKNTGDTTAYIRAAVVVTWQDADGNIYGQRPVEGTDYAITWSGTAANGGWKKGEDGFYYYLKPVFAGDNTATLFTDCAPVAGKAPEGYSLAVEIVGSGIQSVPDDVVQEEWSNGKVAIAIDSNGNLAVAAK